VQAADAVHEALVLGQGLAFAIARDACAVCTGEAEQAGLLCEGSYQWSKRSVITLARCCRDLAGGRSAP